MKNTLALGTMDFFQINPQPKDTFWYYVIVIVFPSGNLENFSNRFSPFLFLTAKLGTATEILDFDQRG
jgi:hypothetical protein